MGAVRLAAVAVILAMAAALADEPNFKPVVTDVTVFKDGHALVMARGKAKLEDGWARTHDVPAPLLGTFWVFTGDKDVKIEMVKAGLVDTSEKRPCLTLDEMLRANVNKRVKLVEQPQGTQEISTHEGVLLGVLEHKTKREIEVTRSEPYRYDRYGRYMPERNVAEAEERDTQTQSSFVMLKTNTGVRLIQRQNIRSIEIEGAPGTTYTETIRTRELAVQLSKDGKPAAGEKEIGMVYVQKGLRWIPNYHIELQENGKAKVTLQGTIVNELEDLENANVRLVVGVPNFIMKGQLCPLALRDTGLRLSSYFRAPDGRPGQQVDLSNAMMSQVAMPARGRQPEPEGGGVDVPGTGQHEDLYIYHKPGVTLKKGESAVVSLFQATVSYKDMYSWELPPIPPRDVWRYTNQEQQQRMQQALVGAKAMHVIELKNTSPHPWTTGPATVYIQGVPLAQQLLTYTSIKNTVEVPLTVATDLNTRSDEAETARADGVNINGSNYSKITVHGKLTVTSFKDKEVKVRIKRKLIGTVTKATKDGEITVAGDINEALIYDTYPWYVHWPWWWFHVNSVSEITWEIELGRGKSATVEYDAYYYRQ